MASESIGAVSSTFVESSITPDLNFQFGFDSNTQIDELPKKRKKKKKAVNQVRAKPANSEVLSSMIDSLGSLTIPSGPEREKFYDIVDGDISTRTLSRLPSRTSSTYATSSVSSHTRGGSGAEHMTHKQSLEPQDEELPGIAEAPTVKTSRRPSQRSHYSTDSTTFSQQGSGLRRIVRSASLRSWSSNSVRSADDGKERSIHTRSITPSERARDLHEKSRQSDIQEHSRPAPNNITNGSSQRYSHVGSLMRRDSVEAKDDIKKGPRIESIVIVRPYATPKNTGRRTEGNDDDDDATPRKVQKQPAVSTSDSTHQIHTRSNTSSNRSSPTKSFIADAIPLRTSSLQQADDISTLQSQKAKSPSSRSGKRVKGKRKKPAFSEDVLEELGEDDETVKRIKELKQLREERMKQSDGVAKDHQKDKQDSPNLQLKLQTAVAQAAATTTTEPVDTPVSADSLAPKRIPDDAKARKVLGFFAGRPNSRPASSQGFGPDDEVSDNVTTLERKRPAKLDLKPSPPLPVGLPVGSDVDEASPRSIGQASAKAMRILGWQGVPNAPPVVRSQSMTILSPTSSSAPTRPTSVWPRSPLSPSSEKTPSVKGHPDLPHLRRRHTRQTTEDQRRATRILENYLAEEPFSRDTLDVEVDSFLRKSRFHRAVRHPKTRRKIAFSEVGDPNGAVVFVCVGMGLTRFVSAFYDELATSLRLRLITPDRPGVGGSEPYPDRERPGPMSWHQDVHAICQKLNITKFSLLAHSAGAIYALATTLVLPHYVHGKVHLLAPWIPPSQFESYTSKTTAAAVTSNMLPRSQRFLRMLPTSFLKAANSNFLGVTTETVSPQSRRAPPSRGVSPSSESTRPNSSRQNSLYNDSDAFKRQSVLNLDQMSPPEDGAFDFALPSSTTPTYPTEMQPALADLLAGHATPTQADFSLASEALIAAARVKADRQAAYNSALVGRIWALATKNSNPAVDLLVCLERTRDVGFRYMDIQRKIVVTHGAEDKRVPVENVRWVAEQINRRTPAMDETADDGRVDVERAGCEVRVLEGEGHGLMASPVVMADVLAEIAREWKGVSTKA